MSELEKAKVIKMPTPQETAKTIFSYAKNKGEELGWDKLIDTNSPAVIHELGILEEKRIDKEEGIPEDEDYRENSSPSDQRVKFEVDHLLEQIKDYKKYGAKNEKEAMQMVLSLIENLMNGQREGDDESVYSGWTPGNFKRLEIRMRQAFHNMEKRPKVYYVGTVEFIAPDPHDMNIEKPFRGSLYKKVGTNEVVGILSSDPGYYGTSTGIFRNMQGLHAWEVVESVENPENQDLSISEEYKKI